MVGSKFRGTSHVFHIGDLVKEQICSGSPEVRIGVITGVKENGDCYVHYPCGLMLINHRWLELVCK